MFSQVYVVLHGEDGVSQTKELQVPGCTLFRRNSQDSFILSAAGSLGAVRGAHIWHDTSGPSPDWYLSRVEVSELSVGHEERRSWLIGGQCWLSANNADGRVERMLRATDEDSSFSKMLSLKLSDYFADFHIWASVFICPSPSSLSHTQRLSVCLQLLSGYACVNAVLISQMDLYLGLESSFLGLSPVSVLTGLASVAVVLPVATWTAFLFRRRGAKPTGSRALHAGSRETEKDDRKDVRPVSDARFEPNLPSFDLHQYTQEALTNKHQDIDLLSSFPGSKGSVTEHVIPPDATLREEDAPSRRSDAGPASRRGSEGVRRLQTVTCGHSEGAGNAHKPEGRSGLACRWSRRWTWIFCLLWSFCCLLLAAVQGTRFGGGDVQLWLHALLVSLACCVFLVHPAVIVAAAATASCRLCGAPRLHRPSSRSHVHSEAVKQWSHDAAAAAKQHREPLGPPASSARSRFYLEKRLEARRRARFLRHVRPPAAATLRKTSRKRRRDELIHQTLRELSVSASMLVLLMCVASGCSHTAVAKPFIRRHQEAFMSVHTREQWWTWTQTSLLDSLYPSAPTEKRVLVGDPILQKTEGVFQSLVSMETPPGTCGHLGCSPGPSVTVVLGRTRSDAASKLKRLESGGWLDGATVALEVQFTLYSPAADLLTSVSLLAERSPSGALRPSARVRSARVRRAPAAWDGAVQVCQVLFLLLSLLRLCLCLSSVWQGGLTGHWRRPGSWAEVALLTVALTYHVHDFHHASCVTEVAELLRSRSSSRPVDVGQLAACEQFLRALRGVLLLLLTLKCATVLSAIRTFGASTAAFKHSLSGFLWLVVSGLILLAASSFGGNLLYGQNSQAFSALPRSLQTLLRHFWGTRTTPGLVHSGSESLYWTMLRLSSTFVWTAAVLAVFSSLVREAKKSRRKRRETFTLTELMVYVRKRLPGIKKQQEQPSSENLENWFLQECESLVDELLLRLDSLAGDSPPGSSMDTQSTVRSRMCMTESTSVSNQEDAAHPTHKFRLNIDVSSEDGFKAKTRLSRSDGTRKHRTGDDPEEQSEQETRGIQTEVLVEVLVHDAPARLQEYECAESL